MQISNQRIRLAVDTSQMSSINDVLTGQSPQFWNGVDLQFELGLFRGAALVDISNLDSITIDLKESDPRTGLPLMSATIASGSLNQGLTLDAWNGGAPADCHALLAFTNAETNLFLSDDSVTFWLVISALTSGSPGHKIVLGATPLIVVEGGEGVTPPASVVNPAYYTAAQSDARYAVAVDLTTINNAISTLNTEMTAVTATANAALPKAGGTMSDALTITGLSGVLKATAGLVAGSATTTDLTEGTNLYWTQARFNTALAAVSGAASGVCPLDSSSLIPSAFLPPLAISNTYVVANQAAMLALAANQGDIAIRTDLSETFILATTPASTLSNWKQLLQPTSAVTSVNSLTGAVTLTTASVPENTNLYYTTARAQADALTALLTGLSTGAGGVISSGDSILSALGKHENRLALDDAKVTGSDRVKIDGSIPMTGMLNFSGTGHAGLMLNNLTDAQKNALSATNGMLVYNTTLSALQYYNGNWLTLSVGAGANWLNGSGAPSNSNGNNGDYYLNTANGSIYQKSAGAWAVIYAGGGALNGPVTFSSAVNIPFTFGSSPAFWQVNVAGVNTFAIQPWDVGAATFRPGFGITYSGTGTAAQIVLGGSQVLNIRQTGWTAWTGTATRGTKLTSSATTQNCAEAIKALIDDLMTHGLIGP